MLKKIILGALLIGVLGALAAGAIYRTAYQTGNTGEAHGLGRGANRQAAADTTVPPGQGQGNGWGRNRADAATAQPGVGQAEVGAWVTIQGIVASVNSDAMTVKVDGKDAQIVVENRPWLFAQQSGFTAQVGDKVTLVGFYDGDTFEVGQISDATNGKTVVLRDQNGRPMWAGRGRRGG